MKDNNRMSLLFQREFPSMKHDRLDASSFAVNMTEGNCFLWLSSLGSVIHFDVYTLIMFVTKRQSGIVILQDSSWAKRINSVLNCTQFVPRCIIEPLLHFFLSRFSSCCMSVSFHYPGRKTAIIFWAMYHPSNAVQWIFLMPKPVFYWRLTTLWAL